MAILEFNDVTFTYPADPDAPKDAPAPRPVLSHLNLQIEKGSFVAVLGHNGSGKSTLAKLSNGILFPQSGQVIVDGTPLTQDEDVVYNARRKVGMVFQKANPFPMSIYENLGVEPKECRRRVDAALKTVGMYAERLKSPSKLSGGQKQRVAVAGIIAMRPLCIVLDEPTAMLDPSGRREVLDTVKKLNKEEGITILLITHYMDEAVQADRVVVMDDGVIRLDGAPRAVFAHVDELKALGLDVPQATELADRLGFAEHAVLNTAECVDVLISNLEEQKLGCTDL